MTTPAQRHFNRTTAALAAAAANPGESMEGSTAYELMLAKLYDDKRRLKEIQSIQRKIEVKREVLPDYDSWVEGVIEGGKGSQDEVLVTIMVWHIDTGNYEPALRIAKYVIQHDLALPDQYERTAATVLVDEVADAALREQKDGQSFSISVLQDVQSLTDDHDMPDQARSKLHKALGYEYQLINDLDKALQYYESALALNDRIGVKRLIDEIKKLQTS